VGHVRNQNMFAQKRQLLKTIWLPSQKLRQPARQCILKWAWEFLGFFEESFHVKLDHDKDVMDIVLIGSAANYFYTWSSDIDVHIFVDISGILKVCNPEIANEFVWYLQDYFIRFFKPKICGRKLEIAIFHNFYIKNNDGTFGKDGQVPDIAKNAASYSVLRDEWIVKPQKYDKQTLKNLQMQTERIYAQMKKCAEHIIDEKMSPACADKLLLQFNKDREEERYNNTWMDNGPCGFAYKMAKRKGLVRRLKKYIKQASKAGLAV